MARRAVTLALLLASCGGVEHVEAHYEGTEELRFEGSVAHDGDARLAEGDWTFWYAGGEVQAEGEFERGAMPEDRALLDDRTVVPSEGREGWWIFTDAEGRLVAEGDYEKGVRHDLWVTWFENGHHCCTGKFSAGKQDGYHVHWDPEGNKRDTRYYVEGRLSGPRRVLSEAGDVLWSGEYLDGELISSDPPGDLEPPVHDLLDCLEGGEIGMATPLDHCAVDIARQLGQ